MEGGPRTRAQGPAEECGRRKWVFLLAGQSNMAGRGGLVRGESGWEWSADAQARVAEAFGGGPVAKGAAWWLDGSMKPQEVTHVNSMFQEIDSQKVCGASAGSFFAEKFLDLLAQHRSAKEKCLDEVTLIPCAVGGTKLEEWEPGSDLYNLMVKRTKGQAVDALFWLQGESDALDEKNAKTYRLRFENMIKQFRREIDEAFLPLFIILPLGDGQRLKHIETVQKEVLGVCEHDPTSKLVDLRDEIQGDVFKEVAETIPPGPCSPRNHVLRSDRLHLSLHALWRLGCRMAELAFVVLVREKELKGLKRLSSNELNGIARKVSRCDE